MSAGSRLEALRRRRTRRCGVCGAAAGWVVQGKSSWCRSCWDRLGIGAEVREAGAAVQTPTVEGVADQLARSGQPFNGIRLARQPAALTRTAAGTAQGPGDGPARRSWGSFGR